MTFGIEVGGRTRSVEVLGADVWVDGRRVPMHAARVGHVWSLIVGPADAGHGPHGRSYEVAVVEHAADELTVHVNGRSIAARASRRRTRSGAGAEGAMLGPQRVVAPMPGRIAKVLVTVGDTVAARQGLVVVEAMKMENELRSPRAGTVTEVHAVEGALVNANTVLVVVD